MDALPFSTLANIKTQYDFEEAALHTFARQYAFNPVYRAYCDLINCPPSSVSSIETIPFLPLSLFKTRRIVTQEKAIECIFRSSGTTDGSPSQHYITDLGLYEASFRTAFHFHYGAPKDWVILALLPSYLERKDASLVYMVADLIQQTKRKESGFYLTDFDALSQQLQKLEAQGQQTLLIGVSFALLDFAAAHPQNLHHTVVMETGGMKGRRKELIRNELHRIIKDQLGCQAVHSEYGMTELLSQAYAKEKGVFVPPSWMKVLVRDPTDPFSYLSSQQTGGLNIIDLANQNSCSFVSTQDMGKRYIDGSFEVLGRFDAAEVRGCNLMIGATTPDIV